ncbi:AfsR/SARP family transcriptional regulator [Streptomyces triticirhizae]|uniref:AfsR/SARP family transcriptional regulator n=1 Tax=Streptomyces triticirhizae TaxID=2483353 RepID=A0A3M2M1Z6_9ACTN|nr:NB-ARC domain-containing protein [Streptomyces triticirhizae]RMI43754.1 AfsR/SARP family transcriptional regulator [Streptomyces triticirhizae]
MDIRLLGLVRVLGDGGRALPLTAPLTCATLAALALYPGELVRTAELARQLWGPTPPEGAAGRLRRQVARLRAVLPRGTVRTLPGGYVLDVPPETTDVGRFAGALRRADALAPTRPEAALAALNEVLPLWTGNPLMGLPDCPLREVERGRLRLLWSRALRLRAEVELRLEEEAPASEWARGDSPAAEPEPWAEEATPGAAGPFPGAAGPFPGDGDGEAGGEAAAFAGIVERATAGDPPPAPTGLPAGIGTFVARAVELGRLRRRLTDASGAPAVCLIDGPGGVGKSTLAVRAARELADRFPDGLLYVDLRGADPRNPPLTVSEARRLLLAAMGTPGKEMPDEAGAAATYHAELGQRRVLLLLDNAVDGAQVTPLLPTEGGSAALVTSRALLAGVPGALRLCLGTLASDEAVALVRSIAAAGGHEEERGTADEWTELVELCGRLPLALRIIGTRMAARPGWRVADFLGPLRDERRRMDELTGDDLDLRASLMVSIDQLAAGRGEDERLAAALFPALGAAAVRSYTPGSVAALMDVTAREAGAALDRLADARIVDCPRPGVYTLHDLLRSAAGWAAARMPGEWHRARLAALANWYAGSLYRLNLPMALSTTYRNRYQDGAARFPAGRPFTSVDEALPWADEVLDDVLALAEQLSVPDFDRGGALAGAPLSHFALESARALETYFGTRLAWSAQARLCELALTVARRRGDRFAEAVTLGQLGKLWGQRGQGLRGAALLRYAITVLRSLGRTEEALGSTLNLVPCLGSAGHLADAIGLAEETLAEVDAEGYDDFRIPLTNNLARCHLYLGDHDRARELLLANYAAARLAWDRTMAAGVLTEYHLEVAEYEEAVRWSERGMAHAAEQPFDPFVVAQQRTWRAEALRGLGEEASAHVEEMHAKAVIEDLNSRENSHLRVRITDRYLAG